MQTQSRVLKWCLIIGIVIVLNLFFNYALSLIYKAPTYEAFCPTSQVVNVPDNQKACVDQGGQWTNNTNYPQPAPVSVSIGKTPPAGYCNLQFTCGNNFNNAQQAHDRNIFIILIVLGAICVAFGSSLAGNMVLGVSLALAGVLSFIIASTRYWSSASGFIKLIILALALGMLVSVAVRKFKNN